MSLSLGIPCSTPHSRLFPLVCSFLHHRSTKALTETVPDDATPIMEKAGNYMTVYSPRQTRHRF